MCTDPQLRDVFKNQCQLEAYTDFNLQITHQKGFTQYIDYECK